MNFLTFGECLHERFDTHYIKNIKCAARKSGYL